MRYSEGISKRNSTENAGKTFEELSEGRPLKKIPQKFRCELTERFLKKMFRETFEIISKQLSAYE